MDWKERVISLGQTKSPQEVTNIVSAEYPAKGITFGMVRGMIRRSKPDDKPKRTAILALSDQHFPFILPGYYDYIAPYRNKVDTLVMLGDEQDSQSISKFRKKYRKPFVEEMIGAREMIMRTVELINPKRTILIPGNHNYRFINYMSDKINDDVLELMPETNLDLIVDEGFNRHDHEHKTKTFYEPLAGIYGGRITNTREWFYQIGRTLFAHPQAYRKADLGTADIVYRYFKENGFDFDTLVLAHTHRMGWAPRGNTCLYECGCLCSPQEYAVQKLSSPQQNGFMYLVQDEHGNLIFDETRQIWLTPTASRSE